MEKSQKRRLISLIIIGIWMVYSFLRIGKHGRVLLTGSWQAQRLLPFYLENSPFYENYQELKQP